MSTTLLVLTRNVEQSCPVVLPVHLNLLYENGQPPSDHLLTELNAVSRDADRCLAFTEASELSCCWWNRWKCSDCISHLQPGHCLPEGILNETDSNATTYTVKLFADEADSKSRLETSTTAFIPSGSHRSLRVLPLNLHVQANEPMEIASVNPVHSLSELLMPAPAPQRWRQFSQETTAVRYASKYKLVFSLLNENIGKGGLFDWSASEALERMSIL